MGYSLVKELSSRGIKVVAFARTKEKLERLFRDDANVMIFAGDVFHKKDLAEAAKGVDIIFHSANIPYRDWEAKLLTLVSNIVEIAKEQSIKLAVVDNIYAYGRSPGELLQRLLLKDRILKKGKFACRQKKSLRIRESLM